MSSIRKDRCAAIVLVALTGLATTYVTINRTLAKDDRPGAQSYSAPVSLNPGDSAAGPSGKSRPLRPIGSW